MEQQQFQTTVMDMFRLLQEGLSRTEDSVKQLRTDMNGRFEQIDKRFDRLEHRMDRQEDELRSHREKLEAVYQSRNTVKIKFGWQWGLVSMFIALLASGLMRVLTYT